MNSYQIKKTECFVKKEIPSKDETIEDSIHIDLLVPHIVNINVYFRKKDQCPLGRDNWIIDINLISDYLLCFKLPAAMKEEDVFSFFKPMFDLFNMRNTQSH